MKILFINGPNLNMLGRREPELYGYLTLDDINEKIAKKASDLGVEVEFYQSNHEGALIDRIQAAKDENIDAFVVNAGAYTHTSIAIRDALLSTDIKFIEVHLSNIFRREEFRNRSYLSDIAHGVIVGFGYLGYELALESLKYG